MARTTRRARCSSHSGWRRACPALGSSSYRRDEGNKALAPAIAAAGQAGVAHGEHIGIGPAGPTIAAFAKQLGCFQIVMGTRGRGGALATLLGSVATSVVRESSVPVTLVK